MKTIHTLFSLLFLSLSLIFSSNSISLASDNELPIALSGNIVGDTASTRFFIDFDKSLPAQTFYMDQPNRIIIDLGDDLSSAGLPSSYLAKVDLILGNIACHRSVRSGRVLNETEMNNLLREMEITPNSGQCNHGRPTYVELKIADVERLFGRR